MKALARFGHGPWMLAAELLLASFDIQITAASRRPYSPKLLESLGGK